MLFTVNKHIFQLEAYFLKRSLFCTTIRNVNSDQNKFKSTCNVNPKLHQENKKLLKVCMLGLPNAGKSTLVNKLIHRSVCPVSSKVHTTMHKAEAIYTEGNTQIIFMDTPGLTTSHEMKTYKLLETFKEDPKNSISEADVIGLLQDVTNVYTRHKFDNFVLNCLKNKREDAQLLLILNKVDRLKKKQALLEVTRLLTNKDHYPKFNDIFMVSALTGDGVDDLRNYLLDSAKEQDWKYEEGIHTDQPVVNIIEQTIRAKLLDVLPNEMPYKVQVKTEDFNVRNDGSVNAVVILNCPQERYVRILLKQKAFKIKCLSFHVETELRHAFRTGVFVRIGVKCTKAEQK